MPISFCQYCIENNATDAGKLFCYAKYETAGITNYKDFWMRSKRYFRVSDETIRRWLNDAMSYNWIGRNNDTLFIRGWQYLFDTLHFPKKACFRFRKKDLRNFKTYCYSAVITYMVKRTQDKELERLKDSHRKVRNGRSNQVPAWVPMSANAIANTLDVPESTARYYRNKAVKLKYFKKKEDVRPFHLKVSELKQFRNFSNDTDGSLFIKDGNVHKQFPDKIKVQVQNIHSPKRYFLIQKY